MNLILLALLSFAASLAFFFGYDALLRGRPFVRLISASCPWRLSVRFLRDDATGPDYLDSESLVRCWIGPVHFDLGYRTPGPGPTCEECDLNVEFDGDYHDRETWREYGLCRSCRDDLYGPPERLELTEANVGPFTR